VPILEEVEGACEMLGLDPLYVANEGIFVAVVKKEAAAAVVDALHNDLYGINARIIGEVTAEHPGKVVLKSRIGGSRVVNYLTGEQLPRIC
jgi:hydrogenase expression/formation protein HypE